VAAGKINSNPQAGHLGRIARTAFPRRWGLAAEAMRSSKYSTARTAATTESTDQVRWCMGDIPPPPPPRPPPAVHGLQQGGLGSRDGTTASATGYTAVPSAQAPLAHREYAPAPAAMRGLTDEQRGKGLDRCRARGGRAPLRSWECCAAPSPERQCGSSTKCSYDQARPASLLTGDRGGAYAHRGEIHGTRRHSIRWHLAPGRGHVPRGRSAARPRQ
jgi:hypothetical protein